MQSRAARPGWLIELSDSPVQPREVAERITAVVATIPQAADAEIAIVAPKSLLSLQAKQVSTDQAQVFPDRQAAIDWLEVKR